MPKIPLVLSAVLAALMAVQAALGLAFHEQYRDVERIRMTWIGNDWVTLLLAVPLLVASLRLTIRGSTRGLLLWLGMLGYGVYNYAFYLFGAVLNPFFPLYALLVVLSAVTLLLVLAQVDVAEVAARFGPGAPIRPVGGYLAAVAVALTGAWLVMWAATSFWPGRCLFQPACSRWSPRST